MEFFEKPPIDLSAKQLVAIFTAHNEAERIPFFLSYYRKMGVQHFLAIDNNSTDNSKEYLLEQPDVSYFFTPASYVQSKAGRLWTTELANHYCEGKWCLTLDLDEQLVFPGCDVLTIADLTDYLEAESCDGLFCVFLDMYHGGPLSEAIYTPGQPFLEVCDHFEVASYRLRRPNHFPHVQVFGGPRQRIFWADGSKGNGPSMRKSPLIKWRKGFSYVFSTHSMTPIRLANVTGALLHFKFFSCFKSFAERELARGDRVQKDHYENYARLTREQDITFRNENSIRYVSSHTLVEHGVMTCNKPYVKWIETHLRHRPDLSRQEVREQCDQLRFAMKSAFAAAELTLSQLPVVWDLLNRTAESQLLWVRDMSLGGYFVDLRGDESNTVIEARLADGSVVARAQTGAVDWPRADIKEVPLLQYAAFELPIPESVFGVDHEVARIALFAGGARIPFAYADLFRDSRGRDLAGIDGVCYNSDDGKLRGWVFRRDSPKHKVAVSIHIDGQFWRTALANHQRRDLVEKGIGDGCHGFVVDLPEWVTDGKEHLVDVLVNGTNLQLRKSPMRVVNSSVQPLNEDPPARIPAKVPATAPSPIPPPPRQVQRLAKLVSPLVKQLSRIRPSDNPPG